MKRIFPFILALWCAFAIDARAQIIETHEFGTLNTQWYIYSDGRTWKFPAQNTMTIKSVEVKSVLASASRGIFHIELYIKNDLIGNWDQQVYDRTYLPYYHSKQVTYSLTQGDTIKYKIYGNQFWTAEGGLLGINHVKLADHVMTDVNYNVVIPAEFNMSQNFPNPFNPITTIVYDVPQRSFVSISVIDILGIEIITLINEEKQSGRYEVKFDGTGLSSGVYVCILQANGYLKSIKMVLLK